MFWQDELKIIDQLLGKLANLGTDISKQITHFESQKTTLENEIAKLQADYSVLESRNEEAKKQFQKAQRLDLEKLQDDQRRVKNRELQLIEKEKELRRLTADAEAMMASVKASVNVQESIGRNHVRK